ncbi:DUF58 domain-containing protein [Alicyclobacillus curvatus]|nr:DUF58 domain-containing protein [Alicyclobacillus curvatus]
MMFYIPLVLALVVWMWPRIWFRVVADKIDVSVDISQPIVEIGDFIIIRITVHNSSWLPCPSLNLSLELPPGLSSTPGTKSSSITQSTFLLMHQTVTFDARCYGWQRGLQDLQNRDAILRMNEGFGLKELFVRKKASGSVVVFPRRVGSVESLRAMRDLNGEIERIRWLLPDEALLRGIRDYEAGDAFKHIAWQATARTGKLMAKQFSSSSDVSIGIVLSAQFVDPHWFGTKIHAFDELCAIVAAFARETQKSSIPLFFSSNAVYPGYSRRQWHGRLGSSAIKHRVGAMLPYTNGDLADLLKNTVYNLPQDAPLVLFSGFLTSEHVRLLTHIARERYVYVVAPDSIALPTMKGVSVHYFESRAADVLQEVSEDETRPTGSTGSTGRSVGLTRDVMEPTSRLKRQMNGPAEERSEVSIHEQP